MPASNRACEMFTTVHGRNGCCNCGRPYGEHYCNAPVNGGRHVCRFNKGHAGPCHPHINASSSSALAAADEILLPMTGESFQAAARLSSEWRQAEDIAAAWRAWSETHTPSDGAERAAVKLAHHVKALNEARDAWEAEYHRKVNLLITQRAEAEAATCDSAKECGGVASDD